MTDPKNTVRFSQARLNDRQVTEMIGLARGLIADKQLNDAEVEYFYKWLAASEGAVENPLLSKLFDRISEILSDDIVDDDERAELISTLNSLCNNDFEIGEMLKATTLPLCSPEPHIAFDQTRFTFTGTFSFGTRKQCETAVINRGATAGSLTKSTDYLVIGEYATDAWQQSSFGRKIEKGMGWRDAGHPISIISEVYWRSKI